MIYALPGLLITTVTKAVLGRRQNDKENQLRRLIIERKKAINATLPHTQIKILQISPSRGTIGLS